MKDFNIKEIIEQMNEKHQLNIYYKDIPSKKLDAIQDFLKRYFAERTHLLYAKYYIRYFSERENLNQITKLFMSPPAKKRNIDEHTRLYNRIKATNYKTSSILAWHIRIILSSNDAYTDEFVEFQTLPFEKQNTLNRLNDANIKTRNELSIHLKQNQNIGDPRDILSRTVDNFGDTLFYDLEHTYKNAFGISLYSLVEKKTTKTPKKGIAIDTFMNYSKEQMTLFADMSRNILGLSEDEIKERIENNKKNHFLDEITNLSKGLGISPWAQNENKNGRPSFVATRNGGIIVYIYHDEDNWVISFDYTNMQNIGKYQSHSMTANLLETYLALINHVREFNPE